MLLVIVEKTGQGQLKPQLQLPRTVNVEKLLEQIETTLAVINDERKLE